MRTLLLVCVFAGVAHADDTFVLEVYDATTAGGVTGELHLNHHLIDAAANETHTTIAPHVGVRAWLELAGYLQGSEARGQRLDFAGVRLEAKARLPHRIWDERIGLAVAANVSAMPSRYDPATYGARVRPIAELRDGQLVAAINATIAIGFDGDLAGHPEFEPAAKLAYFVADRVGLGVEGYGTFGDVPSEEHGFLAFDYKGRAVDLNVGIGLSHGSADHPIGKLIFTVHP